MNSGKELVRLLEEETVSLRSQGRRVAAEALDRVIAKFGRLERLVEEFRGQTPGRLTDPTEAAGGICRKAPPDSDLMLKVSLESIRCYVLRTKQDSFRISEFSLSLVVGAKGFLAVVGCGQAEVLDISEEGKKRAATDLSNSLPSPIGHKRMMLDLELPLFGSESKIIRFKFRDVEIWKKPEPVVPPAVRSQALRIWDILRTAHGLSVPNCGQTANDFVDQLAYHLDKTTIGMVWKVPSTLGKVMEVVVLPAYCTVPQSGYYRISLPRDEEGAVPLWANSPRIGHSQVIPAGEVARFVREDS